MKEDNSSTLKSLYLCGDLAEVISIYESSGFVKTNEALFWVAKTFQEMQRWGKAKAIFGKLQENGSEDTRFKAALSLDSLDFVLEYQSRAFGKSVIDKCEALLSSQTPNELYFFAATTKFRVQAGLITLGLANANSKWNLIESTSALIKPYFKLSPEKAEGLLAILMGHGLAAPMSDPDRSLQLFEEHSGHFEGLAESPFGSGIQLIRAEALLKSQYSVRDKVDLHKLPKPLEEIEIVLTKYGHVCGKELIWGLYGSHLLYLDYLEGAAWIEKCIARLWAFGHVKPVLNYKKQTLSWAADRSQINLFTRLSGEFRVYEAPEKAAFTTDLEQLHLSHKHFSGGDYDAGRKVLIEHLSTLQSETNKVHFISLIVNNADRLEVDKTEIIKMIVSEIRSSDSLQSSVLLAQLYNFRAIIQKNKSLENFQLAIDQFSQLGMDEEVINQLINLFLEELIPRSASKQQPLVTEEMSTWLSRAETLTVSGSWIKYPLSAQGNLAQTFGKAFFFSEMNEEAVIRMEHAHDCFMKAGHLTSASMNANYLVLALIKLGRQKRELHYYDKAIDLMKKALPIFEKSELMDFIWRMQFHMALCLSEPLQHELIVGYNKAERIENAERYYFESGKTLDLMFKKTRNLPPSDRLLAISQLNRSTRQLIFSGFYFFLFQSNWRFCLEWLERSRGRSMTMGIAKGISPTENLEHQLILGERELINDQTRLMSITEERDSQAKLNTLYKSMFEVPKLREYAFKKSGDIPDFEQIKRHILAEEGRLNGRRLFFIYYYTHSSEIYAFGISSREGNPLMKRINLSAHELQMALKTQLSKILTNNAYEKSYESTWTKFSDLISPLTEWTAPGDVICVIPFGFLHNLPFHSLQINDEPLIKRNPVFYNSSLASWYYQGGKRRTSLFDGTPSVYGDPQQNLPKAAEEAKQVAKLLGAKELTGSDIVKSDFLHSLKNSVLVHFAGHGSFNDRSLGLSTSTLDLSGNVRITAEEIINQQSKSRLVVLSACDTARHVEHEGEEHAGLVSALLASGVSSIIASQWQVVDEDAKDFFLLFYPKLLAGKLPVDAMQEVMIETMSKKNSFFHWGAFVLNGDF